MNQHRKNFGRVVAIVACCLWIGLSGSMRAQQESSVLVDKPATSAAAAPAYEMPAPAATGPAAPSTAACCAQPCIEYRTHLGARRMLRCHDQVQVTMAVDNPADCECCTVEVPLCIPCCCTGTPTVTSDCGLLGRGVVEYCWPCGFKAKVVFRPILCDIVVHYSA